MRGRARRRTTRHRGMSAAVVLTLALAASSVSTPAALACSRVLWQPIGGPVVGRNMDFFRDVRTNL